MTQYYTENPDLLGDERSQKAIQWSLEGLECILKVLDKYDLTRRP